MLKQTSRPPLIPLYSTAVPFASYMGAAPPELKSAGLFQMMFHKWPRTAALQTAAAQQALQGLEHASGVDTALQAHLLVYAADSQARPPMQRWSCLRNMRRLWSSVRPIHNTALVVSGVSQRPHAGSEQEDDHSPAIV